MNSIPRINNGKRPDEPYNARLGFWLPADTPYGNFQLKLLKISQRIDETNRRLVEAFTFWEQSRSPDIVSGTAFERHELSVEQVIYLMRRTCDEFIALVWCLVIWEKTKKYPPQIKVDCIAALLKDSQLSSNPAFAKHLELLQLLNEISNAYKHSFINSDHTVIGRDEPCVLALALAYNRLSSGASFYSLSLAQVATSFDAFYQDAMAWLLSFSETHR